MNEMQPVTEEARESAEEESAALRVGIQGYAGAFHEIATRNYFQERPVEIVPAHTFKDLIKAAEAGDGMDTCLMAIENTLSGSIMPNYRLLLNSELVITGEVYLRIEQNLITWPGTTIEQLEEVHSHPVAIAQCEAFFSQYPHIRLVETVDTALSVRDVRDNQWKHIGAVGSQLAAELYGLDVLAPSIETNKHNHTRFLVLERQPVETNLKANKVSLSFSVDHTVGSLYKVLAVLSAYNVNMTKIQSKPFIGRPWEYLFFVDFTVDGKLTGQQAIDAIRPITHELHVLGMYVEGTKA